MAYSSSNNSNHSNNASSPGANYFASSKGSESTAKLNKAYGDFLTITPRRKGKQRGSSSTHTASEHSTTANNPTTTPNSNNYNDSTLSNSETLRVGGGGGLVVVRSAKLTYPKVGSEHQEPHPATTASSKASNKIIAYANVSPPNAFSDVSLESDRSHKKFAMAKRTPKTCADFTIAV